MYVIYILSMVGFGIFVWLLIHSAAAAVRGATLASRFRKAHAPGCCPACRYERGNIPSHFNCSECGKGLEDAWRSAPLARHTGIGTGALLGCLVLFLTIIGIMVMGYAPPSLFRDVGYILTWVPASLVLLFIARSIASACDRTPRRFVGPYLLRRMVRHATVVCILGMLMYASIWLILGGYDPDDFRPMDFMTALMLFGGYGILAGFSTGLFGGCRKALKKLPRRVDFGPDFTPEGAMPALRE